ncbi:glycoside hydrolase family 79 protein [Hebeloma cylindrosporum]|uniref:Glycoside hydrolase family 79 protein n=1 Tax=Hebeloma cylindrosporum TaxID=76867 RepID=A0A0C2YLI0_HEBCY|nr:glycoside hydrolase family 79 protein [Hebeloma cylindrosporum h7]
MTRQASLGITAFGAVIALCLLNVIRPCSASITVWYQEGQAPLHGTSTGTALSANYTGSAAYNPNTLDAPPPPGPAGLPTQFALQLSNTVPPGASIAQSGSFFGFSVEMSVVNQVCKSLLQVPFLNLMANIQQRAGRVVVRVGGNTQETAVLVDSTPDGRILEKDLSRISNPTQTPPLIFTPELLWMLRNISSLVNVRWHLGIPFNDTSNFRLGIAEQGQQILGDYLIGLQVGNEPDLYAAHGHRPMSYGPYDYFGEFGDLVEAMAGDEHVSNRGLLIGPNVNTGDWTPEMVWNTGFVDSYSSNLAYLAVEHYPTDNCFAQYGVGTPRDPQTIFPDFLNHTAGQMIIAPYLNSTAYAQTKGKPLLMFETNTASCGGFVGISDSFGAALWGLDYAMQMAYSNFSGALFHVGGQNVYYNPFTPPSTNQSTFRKWTIGPIYYSALVMAEAIGPSNNTQVIDLAANNNNVFSPAYAIYESGNLMRVLLFNYVTDSSGASNLSIDLTLSGGQNPRQVQVKYLQAPSVSQKGNFTWGGQTFGANFESDGRLSGTEDIQTVSCSVNGSGSTVCTISVPAPAAALVFLSSSALTETAGSESHTFPTTAETRTHNTVTVDPSLLATSNGHTGMGKRLGSTSVGSANAAETGALTRSSVGAMLAGALVGSMLVVGGTW